MRVVTGGKERVCFEGEWVPTLVELNYGSRISRDVS
jgi:hypothetical protein